MNVNTLTTVPVVFPVSFTASNYSITFGFSEDNGRTMGLRQCDTTDRTVSSVNIAFFNHNIAALQHEGAGNYIFIGY